MGQTFRFTATITGADVMDAAVYDALYEAGCDDSLIGARGGVQFADFDREADSLVEAVVSAVEQIQSVDQLKVAKVTIEGVSSSDFWAVVGALQDKGWWNIQVDPPVAGGPAVGLVD